MTFNLPKIEVNRLILRCGYCFHVFPSGLDSHFWKRPFWLAVAAFIGLVQQMQQHGFGACFGQFNAVAAARF